MLETVKTCPLGSTCTEVVDGKIHVCEWWMSLKGTNPQTGQMVDESGCAIRLQTLVSVDQVKAQDRVTNTFSHGAKILTKAISDAASNDNKRLGAGRSEHGPAAGNTAAEHSIISE